MKPRGTVREEWDGLVRTLRLIVATNLIRLVLRLLPKGDERYEFAVFIGESWIGRAARAARQEV